MRQTQSCFKDLGAKKKVQMIIYLTMLVQLHAYNVNLAVAEAEAGGLMKAVWASEWNTVKQILTPNTLQSQLITMNANGNARSFNFTFILDRAIDDQRTDIVQLLVQNLPKNAFDPAKDNNRALRKAQERGYAEIVNVLLEDDRVASKSNSRSSSSPIHINYIN